MATKQIEGHEPAFGHGNHEQGGAPGMSLRDWFAGQVLSHACARARYEMDKYGDRSALSHGPRAARLAYEIADAMLAERSKR